MQLSEEVSVCVKTSNLEVLTPALPEANEQWQRENNAESLMVILYHKELAEFASSHLLAFAEWWRNLGNAARAAALTSVCSDLPQTMEFEENLLPEWNIETMSGDKGCACSMQPNFVPPCEHGHAMRLLHDLWQPMHHPGPEGLAKLLEFDFRMIRNLQGAGMIQSPRLYGQYGTVCNSDGTKCKRLERPIVSPELAPLRGALDRGNIIWAHVRAVTFRRRCVAYMILVSLCDEFRRKHLHDDYANTNGRLMRQIFLTPEAAVHKIDIRVLDQFLRPRDCFNAPFHELSHFALAPPDGQSAIVETLPAMMRRLHNAVGADCGRLKHDPISRGAHRFMRSGEGGGVYCSACGERESEAHRFLVCSRCRLVRYCAKSCQVKHWPEHKPACKKRPPQIAPMVIGNPSETDAVAIDVAVRLSPCDSLGAFDLIVVWGNAEGRKTIVHIWMRHGHGVERSMTIGSAALDPKTVSCPVDHIADLFCQDDESAGAMNRFKAFLRVSRLLARGLIERAALERRTSHRDSAAIDSVMSALSSPPSASSSQLATPDSELASWLAAPVSNGDIVRILRLGFDTASVFSATSELTSLPLERFIVDFLERFEASTFSTHRGGLLHRFDATQEVKGSGFAEEDVRTVGLILKSLTELDAESDGAVRSRMKRVFEFVAAWLYAGLSPDGAIVGSSSLCNLSTEKQKNGTVSRRSHSHTLRLSTVRLAVHVRIWPFYFDGCRF